MSTYPYSDVFNADLLDIVDWLEAEGSDLVIPLSMTIWTTPIWHAKCLFKSDDHVVPEMLIAGVDSPTRHNNWNDDEHACGYNTDIDEAEFEFQPRKLVSDRCAGSEDMQEYTTRMIQDNEGDLSACVGNYMMDFVMSAQLTVQGVADTLGNFSSEMYHSESDRMNWQSSFEGLYRWVIRPMVVAKIYAEKPLDIPDGIYLTGTPEIVGKCFKRDKECMQEIWQWLGGDYTASETTPSIFPCSVTYQKWTMPMQKVANYHYILREFCKEKGIEL